MPNRIRNLALSLLPGLLAGCGGGTDGTPLPPPTTPDPTPPPAPPSPATPGVPSGLRVSARGGDFIEWTWNAVEGVNGYDVQFSLDEAFTDEDEIVARTSEELSFRREDLAPGTSAYLRVRSASGDGDDRVTSAWSTQVTGVATPLPPGAPANVVPSATAFGPVEAGKWADGPMSVMVLDTEELPVAGAAYRWEADENAGWVYPRTGLTGADGRISATWVAGSPGDGVLMLTVGKGASVMTTGLETRSVASERPPWGYVTLWWDDPDDPTGYSIDVTPLTEPRQTYYAAINVNAEALPGEFNYGFYMGLQRAGSRYDRQLQFSMWDAVEGTGDARVIEQGDGAVCSSFGGEGTGQECEFNYPWSVGETYRFEVTWEPLGEGVAITGHVTELATGERRFLGVLGGSRPLRRAGAASFVEDFRRTAPTCLAQEVRSAAFRRARVRTNEGVWRRVSAGILTRDSEDLRNPGTPPCANSAANVRASGLEVVIGGRTAMDPEINWVTIPE